MLEASICAPKRNIPIEKTIMLVIRIESDEKMPIMKKELTKKGKSRDEIELVL